MLDLRVIGWMAWTQECIGLGVGCGMSRSVRYCEARDWAMKILAEEMWWCR